MVSTYQFFIVALYFSALVWKVARYTSSGPVFFEPEDNYIDGGLKANNPTDFGLTVIQKEMDTQQELLNIAVGFVIISLLIQ